LFGLINSFGSFNVCYSFELDKSNLTTLSTLSKVTYSHGY